MSTEVATVNRLKDDPSTIGWPPTFVLEVALGQSKIKDICEAYAITRERWDELRADPLFIKDVESAVNELKKDGVSYKVKARLQAEAMLPRVWEMVHKSHDIVPPSVQADLIKFTARVGGLDNSRSADAVTGGGTALQININLR